MTKTVVFGRGLGQKPGFVPKGTLRSTIAAKCKDCTWDPLDSGTWRQQVGACTIKSCPLWPYRPKSSKKGETHE